MVNLLFNQAIVADMSPLKITSLLLILFVLLTTSAMAERYKGDPADRPPLDNLIAILKVQAGELEKLVKYLSDLDQGKQALAEQDSRIGTDERSLQADRKKMADASMTQKEFDAIWISSGELQRHEQLKKQFKMNIDIFNTKVVEFNDHVAKMKHALGGRSPKQVQAMISEMHELVRRLQKSLDEGNIEMAKFIAKQSKIAGQFGYKAQ